MSIEKIKLKIAKIIDDRLSLEEKKTLDEYWHMPTGKLMETKKILDKQWESSKTYKRWMGRSVARVAQTLAISGLIASGYIYYSRGNEKQEFMDKINKDEHVTMIEGMPMYATYPDHFKDRIADGEVIKPAHSDGGPKVAVTYSPESVAKNGGPFKYANGWFLFDKIAFAAGLTTLLFYAGESVVFKNSKRYAEDTKVFDKYMATLRAMGMRYTNDTEVFDKYRSAFQVMDMRQKERE